MKKLRYFVVVLLLTIPGCSKKDQHNNTLTDIDGNIYKTVTIGDQTWMAENLRAIHYPNGTEITLVADSSSWINLNNQYQRAAYCFYNNNANGEATTYGALYTYNAAKNACPTGWHLPDDEEWKTLEMFVGMSREEADKTGWRGTDEGLKLKSTSGWQGDGNGTDAFGFSALPGGYHDGITGDCTSCRGYFGYFWCSTSSGLNYTFYRKLYYYPNQIGRFESDSIYLTDGYNIRCIKD